MPTLHDVTDKTKNGLKWGGILFIAIITLIFLFRIGVAAKDYFFPKPPTPPTVLFGKLPPITFPQSVGKTQHDYVIDTITGRFPVFLTQDKKIRDRISVYKIHNNDLTLLDLQNATNQVQAVGFTQGGIQIKQNLYRFTNKDPLPKTIDIDIISKNYVITSPFFTDSTVQEAAYLPDQSFAKKSTDRFMDTIGNFPSDIDRTKTKTQLLTLENGKLIAADKLRLAKIIRVDYYQKDIDELPIYYPDFPNSSLHFLVASSENFDPDIISANFFYQSITKTSATYPLKPISVAFDELQKGNAYISADYIKEKTVKIKDILIGYFAQGVSQDYLMPVYVFKGGLNDEFYAFVPAISEQWITK